MRSKVLLCAMATMLVFGNVGASIAKSGAAQCVPGQQIVCACPGGSSGAQVCAIDGARFEPCMCGTTTPAAIGSSPDQVPTVSPNYYLIPAASPSPPLSGKFKGGLAMVIIGGTLVPVGIGLLAAGASKGCEDHSAFGGHDPTYPLLCGGGITLLAIDAGLLIGGIVMMVGGRDNRAKTALAPVRLSTNGLALNW